MAKKKWKVKGFIIHIKENDYGESHEENEVINKVITTNDDKTKWDIIKDLNEKYKDCPTKAFDVLELKFKPKRENIKKNH